MVWAFSSLHRGLGFVFGYQGNQQIELKPTQEALVVSNHVFCKCFPSRGNKLSVLFYIPIFTLIYLQSERYILYKFHFLYMTASIKCVYTKHTGQECFLRYPQSLHSGLGFLKLTPGLHQGLGFVSVQETTSKLYKSPTFHVLCKCVPSRSNNFLILP